MPLLDRSWTRFALAPASVLFAALLAAAPAEAVKRRAFVTSVTGTGNLHSWPDAGGEWALDAGDNICRARAAAASLPNASSYRAWLSTATTDAYCHVRGQSGEKADGCTGSPQAAGPWYRVNGTSPLTGTVDELTAEREIYQAVRYDEFGTALDQTDYYWTGTSSAGVGLTDLCSSWVVSASDVQGLHGSPTLSAGHWTYTQASDCSEQRRLLCVEPGTSEVTPVAWVPSALAFVTSAYGTGDLSGWLAADGASGIAAGDAICRNLAAEAHLPAPDSFVAWLSNATTDAADRLTLTNVAYRRLDHFRIAISKADLVSGGNTNSIHVDERGEYLSTYPSVMTGTGSDGSVGVEHCDNWSDGTSGELATRGYASHAYDATWTDHTEYGCNQPGRIYCFSNKLTLFWDGFEYTEDTSRWSAVAP